jgi:peptidylprolyl isomerase
VCALSAALLLTLAVACSSSHSSSSSDTAAPATTAATDTTPSTSPVAASPTIGPATTTLGPASVRALPNAPAVDNATNVAAAPTISAGKGTPPATLVIRELVFGKGASPSRTSTVTVQYVGANYVDGKVFDSSWQRGQPTSFPVSGVVPGFARGLLGMRVGGRREVVIPPSLGYGSTGSGPVGPNETLVFVIDLLAVQ